MNKYLLILLLSLCAQTGYTAQEQIPKNPHALPPPPPMMPQSGHRVISAGDTRTRSSPTSAMGTIPLHTTGSYECYTPRSHPIPLDKAPVD